MLNREQYVKQLKAQLDAWNTKAEKWEAKTKEVQANAHAEYDKQLAAFRAQCDKALEQMRKLQAASGDAWQQFVRDTDQAWEKTREVYETTSAQFYK